MRVQHIRLVARHAALADQCRGVCQCGEALRVVRPVLAVRLGVGIAWAGVQMRRVQDEHLQAAGLARQDGCVATEIPGFLQHCFGV